MSKQLPERPNLDHLREQAKDLLKAHRAGDPDALSRIQAALPHLQDQMVALHDAQSAIAREYGFQSWKALLDHVEQVLAAHGITDDVVKRYVELALSDKIDALQRMLELYPGLPRYNPTCALVSGEADYVRTWLAPEKVIHKLPPKDYQPLEYVCYSRIHRLDPNRYEGQLETARLLLDAGANPNTYHLWDGNESAPLPVLYGASGESGHLELVRLLLERGAHPNDGESVYHSAQFNRRDILDVLLAYAADISNKDAHIQSWPNAHRWNNTPLFFLAGHRPTDPGMLEAAKGMEWLLEHGADPNVPCYDDQETALHAVCRGGWSGEMVELMLRHGGDPTIKRRDGRTPYDLAMVTGNRSAATALERAGAAHKLSEKDAFLSACAFGDKEAVLRQKHLIGQMDKEADMLFVKLAEYGVVDGVRTMLEAGFDVSARGQECATALHFASFTGRADVVRLLLQHGAPVDVKDGTHSSTPLGWAQFGLNYVRSPSGDYVGVIKALIDHGASREELTHFLDNENLPEDVVEALNNV